jgi:hypothetical protein
VSKQWDILDRSGWIVTAENNGELSITQLRGPFAVPTRQIFLTRKEAAAVAKALVSAVRWSRTNLRLKP